MRRQAQAVRVVSDGAQIGANPRVIASRLGKGVDGPVLREVSRDPGILAIKEAIERSRECGEPVVIRVAISPVAAAWLLGMNVSNRMLSEPKVIQHSNDMKEGRWVENGDGLAVSKCLALNNGQHRCYAIISSGVTVTTNITVGLTRESRATNDIGLPRSMSNLLAMEGVPEPAIIGPMTKLIIGWETGGNAATRPARESSVPRIQERIDRDPAVIESAVFTKGVKAQARGMLSNGQIGFLHYMLKKHCPEQADRFMTAMATGTEDGRGLDLTDPRYVARDRLIRDSKNLDNTARVELVYRCWNLWRKGRTVAKYMLTATIPELK
jgi:hypothetical protein